MVCSTLSAVAITVTQLTAFLAVVRGGSVTAAADELVVTLGGDRARWDAVPVG
jgi:hypothetical protein